MLLIVRWVVHAIILLVVVNVGRALGIPVSLSGFVDAALVVFLLALANTLVRPVMKTLLLPLNCMTLGILGFVVNVLVLWAVDTLVEGFRLGSVGAAVYCSILLSILGAIANKTIRRYGRDDE